MPKTKTNRRELLQLAKTYDPAKNKIAGWYMSEKLDGGRCFWDGGVSRGLPAKSIPWANQDGAQALKGLKATGLWSRYANPIQAPDEFLNLLPAVMLDGELWAGRGKFQTAMSIIRSEQPDPSRWQQIQYACYGCPAPFSIFQSGEIKNTNLERSIDSEECMDFVFERIDKLGYDRKPFETPPETYTFTFQQEMARLVEFLDVDRIFCHRQVRLDLDEEKARYNLDHYLNQVLSWGGEGLIIRDPDATWTPKRVPALLKYKPFEDDEGTVVGFIAGRETDKGSKLRGKLGALILNYKGKRLELSGFTDEERELGPAGRAYAWDHPGEGIPNNMVAKHFNIGQTVTFKYRELTDDGIPKEARYFRPRDDE